MKKKTLIIGLASLLGLVAIAATYFLLFQKKELTIKDTVKVIPQSAGFLIEIRDFDSFNNDFINDNSIFETLKNLPAFELVNNYFENIDSIIQKHGLAKQFLNSNPLLASAHVSGKDNLNWFFAIALPLDSDGKSAISLMKNIFADSTSCSERKYENETIYELKYNIGKRTLSFAVYGKILMWSHSGLLI
ncbi:MAG: hypothetical protein GX879_02770, partial [Bacteroidales bacterium]|nr:hypothetical protein [Bacteroidales bacterium]